MVHGQAAFGHHFFQISVAQRVTKIRTTAGQNDLRFIMSPFERIRHAVASVNVDSS